MYKVNRTFAINPGFQVNSKHIVDAAALTNQILSDLPATLYKCIDFKTVSSVVGAVFCDSLASMTKSIVNPIEKGHPDLVPPQAAKASEAELRNYPRGLEVKSTVGNVTQGANLRAGVQRISELTGITWQAHHREVSELLGIVWDFLTEKSNFRFPAISGVFYSSNLVVEDWGVISGTTGRNTKVSGMRVSGKEKMGEGWVIVLDQKAYVDSYRKLLSTSSIGS